MGQIKASQPQVETSNTLVYTIVYIVEVVVLYSVHVVVDSYIVLAQAPVAAVTWPWPFSLL